MLERWQLARPDLVNNTADPGVREDIGFNESDPLGRANVLDQFVGRGLVPYDGQDVALGAQGSRDG